MVYIREGTGTTVGLTNRANSGIRFRTSGSASGINGLLAQQLISFDLGGEFRLGDSSLASLVVSGTRNFLATGSGASLAVETTSNEWFVLTPSLENSQLSLSGKIWRKIDVSNFGTQVFNDTEESSQELVSLEGNIVKSLGIYGAIFNDGKEVQQGDDGKFQNSSDSKYWQERNFGVAKFEVSDLQAIPEPSTYALIFGISSLAFTTLIRRKIK